MRKTLNKKGFLDEIMSDVIAILFIVLAIFMVGFAKTSGNAQATNAFSSTTAEIIYNEVLIDFLRQDAPSGTPVVTLLGDYRVETDQAMHDDLYAAAEDYFGQRINAAAGWYIDIDWERLNNPDKNITTLKSGNIKVDREVTSAYIPYKDGGIVKVTMLLKKIWDSEKSPRLN